MRVEQDVARAAHLRRALYLAHVLGEPSAFARPATALDHVARPAFRRTEEGQKQHLLYCGAREPLCAGGREAVAQPLQSGLAPAPRVLDDVRELSNGAVAPEDAFQLVGDPRRLGVGHVDVEVV